MQTTTRTSYDTRLPTQPPKTTEALEVLREIRDQLEDLNAHFDEFAKVFLNARFAGKGTDRWGSR